MGALNYRAIADLVWDGMTVPDACEKLGYTWSEVDRDMSIKMRGFMIDVSMIARYRDYELMEDMCQPS